MAIVFFDGVCGLCNRSVDFLIRADRKGRLRFSPLQGESAGATLPANRLEDLNTIIYQDERGLHYESDAILRILLRVGGCWKLAVVAFMVPRFVRNAIYRWISRNRYRWFGKKETCRLPTPAERSRFLP